MIMKQLRTGRQFVGALALVAGCAFAQAPTYGDPAPAPMVPGTVLPAAHGADVEQPYFDLIFMCEAAMSGILEVKMGRIAAYRANSSQVRQFAQTMANDHSRSNRKLKEMAWARDLKACEEMDRQRAQRLIALQRYTGDDFDREYLTLQVDEHRRTLRLFQLQTLRGVDGELRDFAGSKLPALEERLRTASWLADSR